MAKPIPPLSQQTVEIPLDLITMHADLTVPLGAQGLIVFAHGSGSSRLSLRNQLVANKLQDDLFATLMLDLLTEEEDAIDRHTREYRFDIPLLAGRVAAALSWVRKQPELSALPVGLFGASTGAAAAIIAAARHPDWVKALVSRGGRPDMADDLLSRLETPSLLIVGSEDASVIRLNQQAAEQIPAMKELVLIPGATHLFEEPGALEHVSHLASEWFQRYLARKTVK